MVQISKSLHTDTIKGLASAHRKRFLRATIPFASDIERMGVHRAPVLAASPKGVAAEAYRALAAEVLVRLDQAK